MRKITVAILGMGKSGQSLLNALETATDLRNQFSVRALWNRSWEVFQDLEVPHSAKLYSDLTDLVPNLSEIDLVVECSHPSVLHTYAEAILEHSDLFVSSPTAFAKTDFLEAIQRKLEQGGRNCYVALGASQGVWDILRLDRAHELKSLAVEMKKHPDSFKLSALADPEKVQFARENDGDHELASGTVEYINALAPQNTNTMSVYALAASGLGFSGCQAKITANRDLDSHIVHCKVETKGGLELEFYRNNPAGHGQVTGSATFRSFLESVDSHAYGIKHGEFIFC